MKTILLLLIRLYQSSGFFWKPRCRFWPTCSHYAAEAVQRHGAAHGTRLAAQRILRCRPWGGYGHDPVPNSL